MLNNPPVCYFLAFLALAATPALRAAAPNPDGVLAQVQKAARAQLVRHAEGAGLNDPAFDVEVLRTGRPLAACSQPVRVEPADTRNPARMRFIAVCPEPGGWRYDFQTKNRITARVVVAANDLPAGKHLAAGDLLLERHDISTIPDALSDLAAVAEMSARRSLRSGEVLRANLLTSPVMVKRGEAVRIVARHEQIEVSMAGEALDSGARGSVVRVRNANGTVIRGRVTGTATVQPVDLPGATSPPRE
jgi:flagella basal body P-ring formation protein FlgA